MTATIDVDTRLADLRDDYTDRLNILLDEGREDLAARLVDAYAEDVSRILLG